MTQHYDRRCGAATAHDSRIQNTAAVGWGGGVLGGGTLITDARPEMSLCSVWSGETQQAFTRIRSVNGGRPESHPRWLDQLLTNKNLWAHAFRQWDITLDPQSARRTGLEFYYRFSDWGEGGERTFYWNQNPKKAIQQYRLRAALRSSH